MQTWHSRPKKLTPMLPSNHSGSNIACSMPLLPNSATPEHKLRSQATVCLDEIAHLSRHTHTNGPPALQSHQLCRRNDRLQRFASRPTSCRSPRSLHRRPFRWSFHHEICQSSLGLPSLSQLVCHLSNTISCVVRQMLTEGTQGHHIHLAIDWRARKCRFVLSFLSSDLSLQTDRYVNFC